MRCLLLTLSPLTITFIASLFNAISCLVITVQPTTLVGTPTLVAWSLEASDDQGATFDLRFVQGVADVGLAQANIQPADGDDSGTALVTFPSAGSYILKAVSGSPRNTVIGSSKAVVAVALNTTTSASSTSATGTATSALNSHTNTSSSTSTSTIQPSQTTSPTPQSKLASSRSPNLPAIVGGTIGAILVLALLGFLCVFVSRRRRAQRREIERRMSFHRSMMVQRRVGGVSILGSAAGAGGGGGVQEEVGSTAPRASDLPSVLPALSFGSSGHATNADLESAETRDVERGLGGGTTAGAGLGISGLLTANGGRAPPLGTGHIVPSPKGPRPSMKRGEVQQGLPAQSPLPSSTNGGLTSPFVSQLPSQSPGSLAPAPAPQSPAPPPPPPKSPPGLSQTQHQSFASAFPSPRMQMHSSNPTQIQTSTSTSTTPQMPLPPLRTRRQAEIADRIRMLSGQMLDVVRAQREARAGRAARAGGAAAAAGRSNMIENRVRSSTSASNSNSDSITPTTERPNNNNNNNNDRWSTLDDGSVVLSPTSPPPSASASSTFTRTTTFTTGTATTSATAVHGRVLEDMQREMVWLRDQEYSAWAMGLTDVLPPGYARYMTP